MTRASPVLVDPAAPGVKVLRATLVGDRLEGSGRDLVLGLHRDGDDPNLVRLRVFVSELEVAAGSARLEVAVRLEHLRDLVAGERRPSHSLHEIRERLRIEIVGVEPPLLEVLVGDGLSTTLVEREGLCEHRQRLGLGLTEGRDPGFDVFRGDGAVVLVDVFDALGSILSRRTRHIETPTAEERISVRSVVLERPRVNLSLEELLTDLRDRIRPTSNIPNEVIIFQSSTSPINIITIVLQVDTNLGQSIADWTWLVVAMLQKKLENSFIRLCHPIRVPSHGFLTGCGPDILVANHTFMICQATDVLSECTKINENTSLVLYHVPISGYDVTEGLGIAAGSTRQKRTERSAGGRISHRSRPMVAASARSGSVNQGDETVLEDNRPEQNDTDSTYGAQTNPSTAEGSKPTSGGRVALPDGGSSWSDLTGYQRDIVETISRMQREGDDLHGLAILGSIKLLYPGSSQGRLYQNLDMLDEDGWLEVDRFDVDGRTNTYRLSPLAERALEHHAHRVADACGLSVSEPEVATDGGDRDV